MNKVAQTTRLALPGTATSVLVIALFSFLSACRTSETIEPSRTDVFERVEQMPQMTESFGKGLMQTVRYPKSARTDKAEGKVSLSFVVTETGRITDVKVVKGVRDDIDREAVRAFSAVKHAWIPGMQSDKPQSVRTVRSLLFFFSPQGTASVALADPENDPVVNYVPDADGAYAVVEHMPEFNGGLPALSNYLSQNLKYPAEARESKITGTVFVGFIVRADGSIDGAKILKGRGAGLDEEALRVVQSMPKWIPGTQDGEAVPVKYTLPIKFALN